MSKGKSVKVQVDDSVIGNTEIDSFIFAPGTADNQYGEVCHAGDVAGPPFNNHRLARPKA